MNGNTNASIAGRGQRPALSHRGAACAQASESQIPTEGEKVEGAPFEVKRDWGTFKLADRIAAKVKAGETINYVFSYQASGIPLFSPQYAAGFETGCKMGKEIYPMECASIAPVQTDANAAGLADRGQARRRRDRLHRRSSR